MPEALSSRNWMAGLSDRKRFYDILIPGSHDAGTFGFDQRDQRSTFVKTQGHDFDEQLNSGIRFLDIRVRKVSENLGDNLAVFHGGVYVHQNLDDALTSARSFLQQNPSETLFISLRREGGPVESANKDITAADIQAYIEKYEFNTSLPAESNHLWVVGAKDFEKIVDTREKTGLADLNRALPLSTVDPRKDPNSKLNYENLALGDIRGRIILWIRDMEVTGYANKTGEWEKSTIAALDGGYFSNGLTRQDNYDGPGYKEKKGNIIDFAKGITGNKSDNKYRVNFTSAASSAINPASSPTAFAVTINAGRKVNNYETDDSRLFTNRSASLKTLLTPSGDLFKWNIDERKNGRRGLNGAMVGDFLTYDQNKYEEFWGSKSTTRGTASGQQDFRENPGWASDHLTKLIWQQNTTYAPILKGFIDDPVTGIPTIVEEDEFEISLKRYLPDENESEAGFILSEITPLEAGLSDENALMTRETSSINDPALLKLRVGKSGGKAERYSTVRDEEFEYQGLDGKKERLTIRLREGEDDPIGRRYFSFVNTIDGEEFGSPYVFAIADSSLLFG
jgi:hypothetical protein